MSAQKSYMRQIVKVQPSVRVVQGDPDKLLVAAIAAEAAPEIITAGCYAETIRVLYEDKNMSWPEIRTWFVRRGVRYHKGTLAHIYRKYQPMDVRDAVNVLKVAANKGQPAPRLAEHSFTDQK